MLGTNLGQVIFLPTLEEKRVAARLSQLSMPPVYRFGDFMFTYQGVPAVAPSGKDNSDLWIVVSSVDPTSPPAKPPTFPNPFGTPPTTTTPTTPTSAPTPTAQVTVVQARTVYAGLISGAVKSIKPEDFAAELLEQNVLRAKFGLPPIPAPETLKQWTEPGTGTDPEPEAKPTDPAR